MDKIEEIKMRLNPYSVSSNDYEVWEKGFDATMELLFIFTEWSHENFFISGSGEWESDFTNDTFISIKEVFNYWFKNIYQPEQTQP